MSRPSPPQTKLWHIPTLDNLELLHATRQTHAFPKHSHKRYAIGVIEQGALGFYYRGENVIASGGTISLCIPGEPHTGSPAIAEGWTYRMFYFEPAVLEQVASGVAGRARQLPYFQSGVITDDVLAKQLWSLHVGLGSSGLSTLAQETSLETVLARLIERHADDASRSYRVGQEPRLVTQIKDYIEANYAHDISLNDLATLAGRSRYQLLRVFRSNTGIPPHAYLRQVRVSRAKALLRTGQPIAEVALTTGFSDQSHLTRWFKRYWGYAPGQYRNSVQDSSRQRH